MKAIVSQALTLTAAALVTIGISQSALAADGGDSAGWVGVQGGMTVPNYTNSSARTLMGITGGAKLGSEYGIGAYYQTSKKDESVNGTTLTFGYDLYGVMAGYFFEGEAKGVYLGAMLGMSKVGYQTVAGGVKYDLSTSPMHWGLVAGYDKMLTSFLSLGGELSYVSIASSSANYTALGATTTQSIDAFSTLNALVSLKFWF